MTMAAQVERPDTEWLLDAVLAFPLAELIPLLSYVSLPTSGTKPVIRKRLQDALADDFITADALASWLDRLSPWGKQHAVLFNGTPEYLAHWQDMAARTSDMVTAGIGHAINVQIPLILPSELSIASVQLDATGLNIKAVQRREYKERLPELDDSELSDGCGEVIYHAFRKYISRAMVMFDWRFAGNRASIHVTTGLEGGDYSKAVTAFRNLVHPYLDLAHFCRVDLCNVIARLHVLEEGGTPEARPEALAYRMTQGRTLRGQAAMSGHSVVGEPVVDEAMKNAREAGAGHLATYVWLPAAAGGTPTSTLEDEVVTVLVASDCRINIRGYHSEAAVRYVLSRIRSLSV